MSVFKIQIHRQPEKPAEQKAEDVNTQTLEGEELSEQPTDVKSAEVPAETVGGPLNIAESSEAEKEEKEQDSPKDKTVRIDGPVSRIFTHALNQLLATESYMMTMVEDPAEEKQAAEEFPEIQVYCWSGNVLNSEDITKLYNEVTCHTDRQFILAVESSNGLSNNVKMLDVIDRLPNLTICYTQKQAINAVRSKLQ